MPTNKNEYKGAIQRKQITGNFCFSPLIEVKILKAPFAITKTMSGNFQICFLYFVPLPNSEENMFHRK